MRRAAFIVLSALVLAGCGGGKTVSPTGPGTLPKAEKGNAAAGKAVFAANGCGGCHTFAPANAKAKIGPDLGKVLKGKDEAFVRESITNPSAEIAPGYPDVMPKDYGTKLDSKQLADLVAFLLSG